MMPLSVITGGFFMGILWLRKKAKAEEVVNMTAGAPTKYQEEFCERVIEMGKYGASKCEMACKLGISMDSFTRYEKDYDKFCGAVKEAMAHSQAWWEEKGRDATFGGVEGFNATSFIFNMKNRFAADWKDKRETELSGGLEVFDKRAVDAAAQALIANDTTGKD